MRGRRALRGVASFCVFVHGGQTVGAYGTRCGHVVLFNINTGAVLGSAAVGRDPVTSVCASGGGVFCVCGGVLHVVRVGAGDEVCVGDVTALGPSRVVYAHCGDVCAVDDGAVRVWSLHGGAAVVTRERSVRRGALGCVAGDIVYSVDGGSVAVALDGAVLFRARLPIRAVGVAPYAPPASPDGRLLWGLVVWGPGGVYRVHPRHTVEELVGRALLATDDARRQDVLLALLRAGGVAAGAYDALAARLCAASPAAAHRLHSAFGRFSFGAYGAIAARAGQGAWGEVAERLGRLAEERRDVADFAVAAHAARVVRGDAGADAALAGFLRNKVLYDRVRALTLFASSPAVFGRHILDVCAGD